MRVLIADDDALIRKWLAMLLTQIPDRDIVVETAENGAIALQMIEQGSPPDLLITDVKMPQLDGLALCQYVETKYPDLPVVILSSYDEFAFVKKALQLGAIDYILKTDMSVNDIVAIVRKVESIQGDQHRPNSMKTNQQLLNTFLANSDTDERTFLLRLDSQLALESLIIVMLRMERPIRDDFLPTVYLKDISIRATIAPYHDSDYIVFMQAENDLIDRGQKQTAVGQFLDYIRQQNSLCIKAWASTLNCCEIGIYTSIQTCRAVLQYKYYYTIENFQTIPYHEEGELSPSIVHIPAYQRFFDVVNRHQVQQAVNYLWNCAETLHQLHCHPADIEKYLRFMCHKLLASISILDAEVDWFNYAIQLLHDVISAPTQEQCRQALREFTDQCRLVSSSKKQHPDTISKALLYIDEHYSEKISLEQVASHVHLHSTYMSEYFKKEMGVTFNDYVNNFRIIRSCEFLRFTSLSIGQIAEQCGFTDQNYFTKVFKKYVGSTPSQYRTNIQQKIQGSLIV